jgi:hypothetical protein
MSRFRTGPGQALQAFSTQVVVKVTVSMIFSAGFFLGAALKAESLEPVEDLTATLVVVLLMPGLPPNINTLRISKSQK